MSVAQFFRHRSDPFYPVAFGVILATYGVWLMLPPSAYSVTSAFSWVDDYIPEFWLGFVACAVGSMQFVTTLLKKTRMVGWCALASFYYWLFMFIVFILGAWEAPGTVIYLWFTIMSAFGYVNWKLNYARRD